MCQAVACAQPNIDFLKTLRKKYINGGVKVSNLKYKTEKYICTKNKNSDKLKEKWKMENVNYYDEICLLKYYQLVYMRRKMLFTVFQYLFSFQRYSSF